MIAIPAGEHTELVAAYVAEKCESDFIPGMYQAMAVLDDQGQFVAGVVFSEFRGHDVQISCATETSAAWRPHVMKAVFSYVFHQLGVKRCTSFTKTNNKRCRSFLEGLGFRLEGNIRRGHDGVKDALVYGLLAEECVYIQEDSDGPTEFQEDVGAGDTPTGSPVPQNDGNTTEADNALWTF